MLRCNKVPSHQLGSWAVQNVLDQRLQQGAVKAKPIPTFPPRQRKPFPCSFSRVLLKTLTGGPSATSLSVCEIPKSRTFSEVSPQGNSSHLSPHHLLKPQGWCPPSSTQ